MDQFIFSDCIKLINITLNQSENGWGSSGSVACAGCAGYFYKILRSQDPFMAEDGIYYYYYYFYFYSNSFYSNGSLAITSLKDINFVANGKFVLNLPYLLVEPNKVTYGAWIRSTNPNSYVTFQITNVTVY